MSLKTIETLDRRPFKHFCTTIGELPSSFIDSMSYYELLAWFCQYLEKTVIPTINENAEAVKELQDLFVELKEYVDNYFQNLDIQEEINIKLDSMVESGQLAEIITAYINLKSILAFNNVQEMQEAQNLIDGSFVKTYGKITYNDGDGAFYKIRTKEDTDIIDGVNLISLNNDSLVAELIVDNELNKKLNKIKGEAERLGVGNETWTEVNNSWAGCVASVRANLASTFPQIPASPSVFAPRNGREASLYRGRDSVALFVGSQGRDFYLQVTSGTVYTVNSVRFPATDVGKVKVGMVIDTTINAAGDPDFSGIVTGIDADNHVITVDGWYKNGEVGQPEDGAPFVVGNIRKIWGNNTAVTLNPLFPQRLACGEEMDLRNNLPSSEHKQIVGYDCVSLGSSNADIGFLARTGEAAFDSPQPGRLERGFVAKDCVEGFETHSNNKNDYLILSKDLDGNYNWRNNFAILNDGTIDNPKYKSATITAPSHIPQAYNRVWIMSPSSNMTFTLPDLTSSEYSSYNGRIYTLLNRSESVITLQGGETTFTLQPKDTITFYAVGKWVKISNSSL